MVDFTVPTIDAPGIPRAQFNIDFIGACSGSEALARARYTIMHPSVFFEEDGFPIGEVFKNGIRLTSGGVPVQRFVTVDSNFPVIVYFIEVRLEELDNSGNVVSSKTHIVTVQ